MTRPPGFSRRAVRRATREAASKPGDALRQGRVVRPGNGAVGFDDRDGRVYAQLGVIIVGEITVNPAGGQFLWSCFLPMTPRMQRAADLDKAKSALAFKVREWCEAAGVVVSAAALARLRRD